MNKIEYIESNEKDIETIAHLWEKLNEHHRKNSKYFAERFSQLTFHTREKVFLEKAKSGTLRIDLARDLDSNQYIGYCISSITKDNEGEIDSIYIEENYRRLGIGDYFMKKAVEWMDNRSVKTKKIVIAFGNEEVIEFYSRYGFLPLFTTVIQLSGK